LRALSDACGLYLRYLGISARGQLQYRSAVVLSALAQTLIIAVEFVGVWGLFQRFGQLPGWSFAQVAFLYGFANGSFAVADGLTTGFDRFGAQQVRTGDFDRLLLRPRSTLLQLAGHEFALKRVGRFASGAAVLIWAGAQLGLDWGPARVLLLAFALLGAVSFFCGIIVLQATLSFWTVESLEIMNVLSYGGVETAQYPMTLYTPWFRRFFTFVVPLACVVYFPLVHVLDVNDPLGSPRWAQVLAPLAGPLFLGASLQIWRLGVRRYTSTGS
jgi:ABC-2 type transport system permease protein